MLATLRDRFHTARADLFVRLLRPRPGSTLLDLGGGDGSLAAWIRERVELDVTVADIETHNRAAVEARGFRHAALPASGSLPFVQYLAHNGACRLVSWTDRFWIKSCWGIVDWELLTPSELRALFPGGAIHVERLLGLPKSIVAYRRASAEHRA